MLFVLVLVLVLVLVFEECGESLLKVLVLRSSSVSMQDVQMVKRVLMSV